MAPQLLVVAIIKHGHFSILVPESKNIKELKGTLSQKINKQKNLIEKNKTSATMLLCYSSFICFLKYSQVLFFTYFLLFYLFNDLFTSGNNILWDGFKLLHSVRSVYSPLFLAILHQSLSINVTALI